MNIHQASNDVIFHSAIVGDDRGGVGRSVDGYGFSGHFGDEVACVGIREGGDFRVGDGVGRSLMTVRFEVRQSDVSFLESMEGLSGNILTIARSARN